MSERDFKNKRARKALRDFCDRYGERLSLFEAELMVLAVRAGSVVAALKEFGIAKRKMKGEMKGILRAARELDEKLKDM